MKAYRKLGYLKTDYSMVVVQSMTVRSVNCEEGILDHIQEDSGISTHIIAAMKNVRLMTICWLL